MLAATIVLAPTLWIFDKAQSYIDGLAPQVSVHDFRWLLPSLAALTYAGCAAFIGSLLLIRKHNDDEQNSLPDLVVSYAQELQSAARHRSVLRLREAMSPLLHAWGFHRHRRDLGIIAADSAISLGDEPQYAAALLDDIGWSQHLLGNSDEARTAIQRAVQIASKAPDNPAKALVRYKAFRHLAIIEASSRDLQESNDYIATAASTLETAIMGPERKRLEMAQLDHARAAIAVIHLGLSKSGRLSPTDTTGWKLLQDCVPGLGRAVLEFEALGSYSRAVKALELAARIAEATGDRLAAQEAFIRAQALSVQSLWTDSSTVDGIKGL